MNCVKIVLCLCIIAFMSACDSGGSSGGGSSNPGNCGVCSGSSQPGTVSQGNCAPGFWCSPFVGGPSRCVPNSTGPKDSYTCTTTIIR